MVNYDCSDITQVREEEKNESSHLHKAVGGKPNLVYVSQSPSVQRSIGLGCIAVLL